MPFLALWPTAAKVADLLLKAALAPCCVELRQRPYGEWDAAADESAVAAAACAPSRDTPTADGLDAALWAELSSEEVASARADAEARARAALDDLRCWLHVLAAMRGRRALTPEEHALDGPQCGAATVAAQHAAATGGADGEEDGEGGDANGGGTGGWLCTVSAPLDDVPSGAGAAAASTARAATRERLQLLLLMAANHVAHKARRRAAAAVAAGAAALGGGRLAAADLACLHVLRLSTNGWKREDQPSFADAVLAAASDDGAVSLVVWLGLCDHCSS